CSKQFDNEAQKDARRKTMYMIPSPESLPKLKEACEKSQFNCQEVHMPKEFEKSLERLTNLWLENDVEVSNSFIFALLLIQSISVPTNRSKVLALSGRPKRRISTFLGPMPIQIRFGLKTSRSRLPIWLVF